MQPHHSRLGLVLSLFFAAAVSTAAHAQTDIAVSLYGAFSGATTGNGIEESPSNAAGGLFELRHISNPLIGYEATYSVNRANQVYSLTGRPPCVSTGCPVAAVSANAHEITGDWLVSLHIANIRPFALAGAGLLLNQPSSGQADTTNSNKPVFVYGAGIDWRLLPHIGLRLQYRGDVYKAPDVATAFSSTGAFAHTAEPMLGAYFRF
jgi:opacity protein-like surface antigen